MKRAADSTWDQSTAKKPCHDDKIKICVSDGEFEMPRSLLKSEFFQKVLTSGMSESINNQIDFKQDNPEVVRAYFQFLENVSHGYEYKTSLVEGLIALMERFLDEETKDKLLKIVAWRFLPADFRLLKYLDKHINAAMVLHKFHDCDIAILNDIITTEIFNILCIKYIENKTYYYTSLKCMFRLTKCRNVKVDLEMFQPVVAELLEHSTSVMTDQNAAQLVYDLPDIVNSKVLVLVYDELADRFLRSKGKRRQSSLSVRR
jgi:hypothetical protein